MTAVRNAGQAGGPAGESPRRLGGRLAAADAARFSGRVAERGLLEQLLSESSPAVVGFVYGPGGIGKSTLLREATRHAQGLGYSVFTIDGRELSPLPQHLERALEGASEVERPLVLIDTYEQVTALGAHLRDQLLPSLPATARVIIAGRQPPELAWSDSGWDALTVVIPLRPLSPQDARDVLRRRGLHDAEQTDEIVQWAAGSPLALALAADGVAVSDRRIGFSETDDTSAISAELIRRLTGDELDDADLGVLAAAAIADHVDERLLGDVLHDVDGDHAMAWLRSLSFVETAGRGVRLHEQVRRAVIDGLRISDPDRDRELRRRVADHLFIRGRMGGAERFLQFGELIREPGVRWGFGTASSRTHRLDRVRAGDVERIDALLAGPEHPWWQGARRWFLSGAGSVLVVRDARGTLAGFSIIVRLADAPPWVGADAVLGPVVEHARRLGAADTDVLIRRDFFDATAGPEASGDSAVVAVMNAAFALRAALLETRYQYCVNAAEDRFMLDFNERAGLEHLAQFDGVVEGRSLRFHLLDHGPGGVMQTGRTLVYRDLGLAEPAVPVAGQQGDDAIERVRHALRAFHEPLALSESAFARGTSVAKRAESVRLLLQDATTKEFGDSRTDRLMQATIERGYLDPDGGHDIARLELNVSRATYFRRLSDAVERLAARLASA